jgi:hypothetical protein
VFFFFLGILAQLILAGVFRPARINPEYLMITLVRLVAFVTVPIQNNIYLYIISISVTLALDYHQFSKGELNKKLTENKENVSEEKEINSEDKDRAKLFYKTILIAAISITIFMDMVIFTNIICLAVAIKFISSIKNKKIRNWCVTEISLMSVLRISREFFNYDSFLIYIIVAVFLIVGSIKYYLIYSKKKPNKNHL